MTASRFLPVSSSQSVGWFQHVSRQRARVTHTTTTFNVSMEHRRADPEKKKKVTKSKTGKAPVVFPVLSGEITSGTKMDGYISSRRNSRWSGGNSGVTGLLVQAVIATAAERAKKITSLTETRKKNKNKNFVKLENQEKRSLLSCPHGLTESQLFVKWSTETSAQIWGWKWRKKIRKEKLWCP